MATRLMVLRRSLPAWTGMLAALAFLACRENATAPVNPTVTLPSSVAWAGGSFALTSSAFTGADTLPVVVVGSDTVAAQYLAPDTLMVPAPQTAGTFTVMLGFHDRGLLQAGTVEVAGGFAGEWVTPVSVGGHPVLWPGSPQTSLVMARDTGLALVDPRLETAVGRLADTLFDVRCLQGVGQAPDGRVTVMHFDPFIGCTGTLYSVRPDVLAPPVDTGPSYPAVGVGGRFAIELTPARWLVASHHSVRSCRRDTTGAWICWSADLFEETYEIVVSAQRDRAVPLGRDYAGIGMPVFGLDSAGPAYLLSGFHALAGAQFTPDGDTLYAVAYRALTDSVPLLVALAASDGAVLDSAPAWPGSAQLVLDPSQPWVYLVGHPSYWSPPEVHVYDRRTLRQVAALTTGMATLPNGAGDAYTVLSPAERALYVFETCSFCSATSAVPVFRFDLLP
jgi:hypothetical protein